MPSTRDKEPKPRTPNKATDRSGIPPGERTKGGPSKNGLMLSGATGQEEAGKSAKQPPVQVAENKGMLSDIAKASRKASGGKLILVPVDFSLHSAAALRFAADLAAKIPGRLIVLHVVHDPGEMPGYYSKLVKKKRFGRIQDIAGEVFEDFMQQFIEDHPTLMPVRNADRLMVIGLPVTRILQVVEKMQPYMVVMGSQGRTGLKHLLLGSKAEQLIQLSPVPVTIVKKAQ